METTGLWWLASPRSFWFRHAEDIVSTVFASHQMLTAVKLGVFPVEINIYCDAVCKKHPHIIVLSSTRRPFHSMANEPVLIYFEKNTQSENDNCSKTFSESTFPLVLPNNTNIWHLICCRYRWVYRCFVWLVHCGSLDNTKKGASEGRYVDHLLHIPRLG